MAYMEHFSKTNHILGQKTRYKNSEVTKNVILKHSGIEFEISNIKKSEGKNPINMWKLTAILKFYF